MYGEILTEMLGCMGMVRYGLGAYVLMFLAVFLVFACLLKKDF